jgi:uncharacterized damage-inducible protein DinB
MKPRDLFAHWEQVRADLVTTIQQFSEAELRWAPFEGAWPAGQVMLHIADCEDNWLHGVVRGEFKPWITYPLAEYPTREAILGVLARAHQRTKPFLEGLTDRDLEQVYAIPDGAQFSLYWILWHVLEHEIHHRGELSLILGLLGREGLDV